MPAELRWQIESRWDGGLLIRDVAGDLFYIADLARLDARSRELLWAYID